MKLKGKIRTPKSGKSNFPADARFQDLIYSKYNAFTTEKTEISSNFDNKGILEKLQILVKMKMDGEEMRAKELASLEFRNWLEKQIKNWPAMDEIVYLEGLDHSKILNYIRELNLVELENKYLDFLEVISKNILYVDKLAGNTSINSIKRRQYL